ncbi:uncharacterized protein BDZ99DRAFT_340777, partial [Mytilinidion resinicola]
GTVPGVVLHNFKAKEFDEVDVIEGETVIVVAQSNPEWVIIKPIGRLGGPGLVPLSYIEIQDRATRQAVPDSQEAIQRAGVPNVVEWKKMSADYVKGTISLG